MEQQISRKQDQFRGCLLGGAIGDALGAPVEFLDSQQITEQFGEDGICAYAPAYGGLGRFTDDTQMTLFTAEGILRGVMRVKKRGIGTLSGPLATAYLRWLETQGQKNHALKDDYSSVLDGFLIKQKELFASRAPGNTCLSALQKMTHFGSKAENDSKGCGGVMRVAPIGLYANNPQNAYDWGKMACSLTHGHPTGQIAGGAFAAIITYLLNGATLLAAIRETRHFTRQEDNKETDDQIELALKLAIDKNVGTSEAIHILGGGWVAEEALAISLYCALIATTFNDGIIKAVNHDGDSDSTGAITGNLLGVIHGTTSLGEKWLEPLELKDIIVQVADDLYELKYNPAFNNDFENRYPPY